jgi:alkylhydroperoxidase family enzyme
MIRCEIDSMEVASMTGRIAPAQPPYAEAVQAAFDRIMPPGIPPLVLFTTVARDERLFERFRGGGLLDPGHLTLRQREIIIDRVTAIAGSEYQWGVHVFVFAERAKLDLAQQRSLVRGSGDDPCWAPEEQLLIRACDMLHQTCDLDDELWRALRGSFSDEGLIELLMLAGFYRMVSYLTNALRLPLEGYAARFPT